MGISLTLHKCGGFLVPMHNILQGHPRGAPIRKGIDVEISTSNKERFLPQKTGTVTTDTRVAVRGNPEHIIGAREDESDRFIVRAHLLVG